MHADIITSLPLSEYIAIFGVYVVQNINYGGEYGLLTILIEAIRVSKGPKFIGIADAGAGGMIEHIRER